MLRKIFRKIFSRAAIIVLLLIFQILFLMLAVASIGERFYFVYILLIILDAVLVIYLMNKREPDSYKLAWIILISVFPLFGGLTYLFYKQTQKLPKRIEERYQSITREKLVQDTAVLNELAAADPDHISLARYTAAFGMFPVYRNFQTEYFPVGEAQFEAMLREIERAELFVFLEYFIVSEGYMLETLSALLIKKARQGVDVRLMYDGIGTGLKADSEQFAALREGGVQCRAFNPFRPLLSSVQNNRDHRKIVVIDGVTAFSGGTNLADEYINRIERFGHWKDTAVMIRGEAVRNYTVMFLQLWDTAAVTPPDQIMKEPEALPLPEYEAADGFIQPFSDSPLDKEPVGKLAYMELIHNARREVCITTPYLIIDEEMMNALCFAAKKGVDVKLITPHIPDKWYVYRIAWTLYPELIEAGVKVYEYTPGFIHAKSCVSDDNAAMVGTVNFDYRSFYLHFESAAILYGCSAIKDIKADFGRTLAASQQITIEDCRNRPLLHKISGALLNMFAPML
ncbi:MAG: cardiolipin synthase [Ruminococcus sp.]|nr:cardiolipin synthase [Ruminococcus sp.]